MIFVNIRHNNHVYDILLFVYVCLSCTSCTDFDEKCSKEDDWDVDMGVYYDPGVWGELRGGGKQCVRVLNSAIVLSACIIVR